MGVRPEAQGAGIAEGDGTPTAISGHGPVSTFPHSQQALYSEAGEMDVGRAEELSRDGAGVSDAGLRCVGAGGSTAQTDHGGETRDMFVDGATRMAVGGEVREAKRRKRCTPRYNPNSLSRAPAPAHTVANERSGTAHAVVLSPGSSIEGCGSGVGGAGEDCNQGMGNGGAAAGAHVLGANVFSDISESVLSDPQVLQLLEDPSGLEDLFADAQLSWLVEPLTHHINAKLVAGEAAGGGGLVTPSRLPQTHARGSSITALEHAASEKRSGSPGSEGWSARGTGSSHVNREEAQGASHSDSGEGEASNDGSSSLLLHPAREQMRTDSAARGEGQVQISPRDGLEKNARNDAGSPAIKASCVGISEHETAAAAGGGERAGYGGGDKREGSGGGVIGSGADSEDGDRGASEQSTHCLPANLDLDAFLLRLHASEAESV